MIEALYWWDEAMRFKERARRSDDESLQREFSGIGRDLRGRGG